jgi:hypothetical protein
MAAYGSSPQERDARFIHQVEQDLHGSMRSREDDPDSLRMLTMCLVSWPCWRDCMKNSAQWHCQVDKVLSLYYV